MQINKSNLRRNGGLQYGNRPDKIILHHPEFHGTIEDLNNIMINDDFSMIGYNYYIRKDGSIWEGRPVEAIGGNCYGQNASSIGLAFEGNFMVDIMTDEQFQSGVELCKYLMNQYGIKEIGLHKKYYNTDCPGINFPVERMIAAVNSPGNYSSDFIKSIQHDLQRVSCLESGEINATGQLDAKTKAAIKQFRSIVGLPNSENIDSQLINALNAITQKPTIGKGWTSNPAATKFIQWWIGCPKTGVFDDVTVQKVKEWQKKAGVYWEPDGVIREESWVKILK